MKKIAVVVLLFVLSACSVKLIIPTQADVDRVSNKYPGYNLTDLNSGEMLYKEKCGQCHRLKQPYQETEDKWKQLVPQMAHKADNDPDATKIDDKSQDLILKYLITMRDVTKGNK